MDSFTETMACIVSWIDNPRRKLTAKAMLAGTEECGTEEFDERVDFYTKLSDEYDDSGSKIVHGYCPSCEVVIDYPAIVCGEEVVFDCEDCDCDLVPIVN